MLKRISALFVIGLWACISGASTDDLTEGRSSHQLKKVEPSRVVVSSFEAWQGAVGDQHPHYFVGRQDIDFSLVEWVRHQAAVRGVWVFLEKDTTALQQRALKIIRQFAPDLDVPHDMSLAEFYYASMVQAFRVKSPSALEKAIFEHLPNNRTYRELQVLAAAGEIFPFRQPLISLMNHPRVATKAAFSLTEPPEAYFFQKQDWETYYSSSVHHDLFDKAKRLLPFSLPYPTNPGELGLALLVRAFMKDVYPIGLSQQDALVHGTKLTPGSLAWHDYFHGKASEHARGFVPWVMRTLSVAPEQNVSAKELLKRAGPYFQKQYGLVMGIYDYLYQQTTGLLIQGYHQDYKTMLVAFFLGLHEYPSFSEKMYQLHDPIAVLQDHLGRVRSTLKSTLSSDALKTDYRTGDTPLSEEEIRKALLPQIIAEVQNKKGSAVVSDEFNLSTNSWEVSVSKSVEYLNVNVHDIKVQRTPDAIDVAVELNDGERFVVGATTNKVRLMVNDDYRKLLNFLGHRISKPVLGEDYQENALIVAAYYERLEKELSGVLDFFERRAAAMMDSGIFTTTKDTPNFASHYFQESWENHQAMEEVLLDLGLERYSVPLPRTFAEKSRVLKEAQKDGLGSRKFF
jgi:hypothetical protein